MSVIVKDVVDGSYGHRAGVLPGDELVAINSHDIFDVLDYRFYIQSRKLTLSVNRNGEQLTFNVRKGDEFADIGLDFETYLMDKQHHCKNKCIFCFIDQLPKGLRPSLYFKDDDARLSFLFGNYITLTNVTDEEMKTLQEFLQMTHCL